MPAVVGHLVGDRLVGAQQSGPVEALRRLHRPQPRPLGGGDDRFGPAGDRGRFDLLDGVGERQPRYDGRGALTHGLDHGVDGVDGHERPGRVVHEDDVVAGRQRVEAELHRLLAGLAAGDDDEVGAVGQRVSVEQRLHLGGAVRRGHDDHEGDGTGGGEGAHRVDQHGCPAQRAERLGGARTEAYAPVERPGSPRPCGRGRGREANRQTSVPVRFVCSAYVGTETACLARRLDRTLP